MRVASHTVGQSEQPAVGAGFLGIVGNHVAQVIFVMVPLLSIIGKRDELYVEHDLSIVA
jgi:hypothetical protein